MAEKPSLRQLWDEGRASFGGWCVIPNAFTVEIMAPNFDWLCFDMQHGLGGQADLVNMLQAAAITRTPAFVRVPWNSPPVIMRALDAGAEGVIVPMVNSAQEAETAARACKFPPDGYRSWGPTRDAVYRTPLVPAEMNRLVVCVVMVETAAAVKELDQILEVSGVDAVFVGPSDLAVSLGIDPAKAAGSTEHTEMLTYVLDACQRHGTICGIFCGGADAAVRWQREGFRMLALQTDARLLRSGCENLMQAVEPASGAEESSEGRAERTESYA